jgi:hypothetical protein
MNNLKIKRFLCPTHTSQPILSMSKDPSATGGLLYCFVCRALVPTSKQEHLIPIEDFLFEFFADVTSTERLNFHVPPSSQVLETLKRLERVEHLFATNAMLEKNTAINRLNKMQVEILEVFKYVRQSMADQFDGQIEFLRQRLETFRLTLRRHFEFKDKSGPIGPIRLTVEGLFEEINKAHNVETLK